MNVAAPKPLVYIIVLNYNGRAHLEYCLPSILATDYYAFRLLLVDNASSDDSLSYTQQNFPEVEILISPDNRGWAGGNNLGIEHALRKGAAYVILANNDIRVDPRWVSAAVQVAEADPRIGIVGFKIMEPRGADRDAGFTRAVAEWSGLQVSEPRWVDGMAMVVRAALFTQIGLIDDGFFAYAEDNDFERRARAAGYRVVATNVPVWHYSQGSFGKIPLRAAQLQIRNNLRLSLKHDNLGGVLYQVARHFAKGCLPFVRIDRTDPVARRLRPANLFVNFGLWLQALAWNAWHLPATLRQRRIDQQRVQATRRQWDQP